MGSAIAGATGWPATAPGGLLGSIFGGALGSRWFQRHSQTEAPGTQNARTHAVELNSGQERTARASAGDPFAAFVAAHEGVIFAYLWRMTGDESAAYDLRQETFIRAWRNFARVQGYERPLAWLYRVATNLALNYRRDQRLDTPLTEVVLDPAQSDPSGRLVERDLVRATLLALAPRERAALALREGQGLSCDEVAQTLGLTSAATRTLLWRARDRFRDLYERANADNSGPRWKGGAQ
jgi:RNA polymerase sigma-70 factor, ECF subfamily